MPVLKEATFNRHMVPGDGGGINSGRVRRQGIGGNAVLTEILLDGLPPRCLFQIAQQDRQAVIGTITFVNLLAGLEDEYTRNVLEKPL